MNPRSSPPWLSVTNWVIFAAWLGGLCLPLNATDAVARPPVASPPVSPTNSPFQRVGPSLLGLGQVRLEQKTRPITFPATVNLREVNVECLYTGSRMREGLFAAQVDGSIISLIPGPAAKTTTTGSPMPPSCPRSTRPSKSPSG